MMSYFRKNIKFYDIIDNFNIKHFESKYIKVKEYFN